MMIHNHQHEPLDHSHQVLLQLKIKQQQRDFIFFHNLPIQIIYINYKHLYRLQFSQVIN